MAVLQLAKPVSTAAAATTYESIAIPAAAPAAPSNNRTTTRGTTNPSRNFDFSTTPVTSNRGLFLPHDVTTTTDSDGYQAQIFLVNNYPWGNAGNDFLGVDGGPFPRFQQHYQQQSPDNLWQKNQISLSSTNSTTNNIPTRGRRGCQFANTFSNARGGRVMPGSGVGGGSVGAPPRHPLSPINSQQQQLLTRSTVLARGSLSGRPPLPIQNSHYEEYQHPHGSGEDYYATSTTIETPSFMTAAHAPPLEVALTTDLVTLSVHDELTFDGVELALHPDLFNNHASTSIGTANSKISLGGTKEDGEMKETTLQNQRPLRPGDLVEMRVWCVRPGMATQMSGASKSGSSVRKAKIKPGTTAVRPTSLHSSLHSRDISSATAMSLVTSSSLLSESPGSMSITDADNKLVGEHLIIGDHLLEASTTSKEQSIPAVFTSSNLSSVFSGAASSLFRKLTAPPSTDNSSVMSHSRDGSVATNNSSTTDVGIHSRDSSVVTANASLINTSIAKGISREEMTAQLSPQLHPLLTNNIDSQHGIIINPLTQVLPKQRDHTKITPTSIRPHSPICQHPSLSSGISNLSLHPSPNQNLVCATPVSSPPKYPTPSDELNIMAQSKDSLTSLEHTKSPRSSSIVKNITRNETLLPTTISTPDIGGASFPRRRPSADPSSISDPPNSGGAESSHTRHESHARADSSNIYGITSSHRRYHSNLGTISMATSDTKSSLPQSALSASTDQKGIATAAKNVDSNVKGNINDMLLISHYIRVSFVMSVSEGSLTSIKSGARTQVSLLRKVADLYNITAYDTITISRISRNMAPFVHQTIAADYLTITFKDQFVSRGDMYNFQKSFVNTWVYEGKKLSFNDIRTEARVIRHGDNRVRSALISEDTKLTFRSRSARIIWLVQMSSEMWDFASPYEPVGNRANHEPSCKIYFDKFVDFVHRLFNKWKTLQVSHNLTVVFFSRTYIRYHNEERDGKAVHVDTDGRMYVDHYKIVLENVMNAMNAGNILIHKMKQEFIKYPKEVKWNLNRGNERTPSTASQGNVLEAINMTLNLLHLHYIDRDVHRTGNSIVVITPGNGVFEIEKNLAGITKQRMMDNGIGSDVLSLGLPPLHVAPFFLFKEKGSSSAEEEQGFDDWKTYFEVPHWMNLSFVDYDNEEEPKRYKESTNEDLLADADNANQLEEENKALTQVWNASNGFLKREIPNSFYAPTIKTTQVNPARQHYKHLITDRGIEDILQACRPRFRGEYGFGLPESLINLIHKSTPDKNLDTKMQHSQKANLTTSRYPEWGALDFDDFEYKRVNEQRTTSINGRSKESSHATSGNHKFDRPLSHSLDMSLLQSTVSLDGEEHSISSGGGDSQVSRQMKSHRGPSVALRNEETEKELGGKDCSVSAIQILMADRDKNIFSITPVDRAKKREKSHSFVEESFRNTANQSFCSGSPKLEGKRVFPPQSHSIQALNEGGIEAALVQYDVTSRKKEGSLVTSGLPDTSMGLDAAAESSSLSQVAPPLPLSLGMETFSLDQLSEGFRPSSMRLINPDLSSHARLSYAPDGFQPLELQRKNYSFHFLGQAKIRPLHDNQGKTPGENAKESKLGQRRKSHWDTPKDFGRKVIDRSADQTTDVSTTGDHRLLTQVSSPQRIKQHNQKPHQQQSHRHRRQPWVLNPFRQEDEEEVLAKRTHNRRRWSHVFPLGEDEFKRHAGPNWKSLCQPAILPMTIDFHPSTQDLEDNKKFSVKQYSVTLPHNMEETTYKSHKELLDDLLMQRMRQDYQIVPRAIIQKSARRDITDHNILEATLSMGHKIHRLSYNPITDSVDVVQYYARFAEDETPQTYHYLLWSSLQQDYVSVFQTFTKYTLPYKWNELDMLISGDAVTNIVEGMRQPRISFVIIPDPFLDSHEENEYLGKFRRLIDYLSKLYPKEDAGNFNIEIVATSDAGPKASSGDKRFVVDLRKKRDDKYEWMELVHDSNCDTRRTFRLTIQWLVCVASKIDNQARLLRKRCSQYGLKLVSVPNSSCLKSCFMNPFAVSITKPVLDRSCVDAIEKALTNDFNFVYDGNHMSDPNEIDCLDGFKFTVNKWSIKKRKALVPARQYLHRTGTLFTRLLRDTRGSAIVIIYLNQRHIAGDVRLLECAREVFHCIEHFIEEECNVRYGVLDNY